MSSSQMPAVTKAIVMRKSQRKPVYHDTVLEERPLPALQKGQVLVKVAAAGFNHRDVWIRQGQYPNIRFGSVMGSDAAGTVIAAADSNDPLLNKRVFLVPMRGWEQHPDAPESSDFTIMGGSGPIPIGAFAQHIVVERDQVIPTPSHLSDEHIAAWPVGGVTAWRAAIVNARVQKGDNVLVTGIGGGVALLAMQFCLARGANVYVTSGSEEKIRKAVALGAKAGVSYKADNWPAQLAKILQSNSSSSAPNAALLSAIIDSGGGDLTVKVNKILKPGGRVAVYGMTAYPTMSFTMREVLKNQQLIGSTMGSHQDLIDATNFIAEHRIVPVVSHIIDGLEAAEEGFELIKKGEQFGKVVIRIGNGRVTGERAKL
ncbi:NAD(P)-binding protein [Wolfiporia cocos MD-104 SS10]|uniref:NAD(P)-binding protein n=1 Tax=Wolfiporia cocos (strain MD-104) TaxID=742152 RepID=A0A2H3JJ86_WOLCO|nr:NAD(P)-binding protein [Wolfiporia cocos MD-104 SS10]